MKEHQVLGIDYHSIRDDDYIRDSMAQYCIDSNEDCQDKSRFPSSRVC